VGSRGECPVGGPQKLKQSVDIVCRDLLQKRSKFENFCTIHLQILDSLFLSGGGEGRMFRGMPGVTNYSRCELNEAACTYANFSCKKHCTTFSSSVSQNQ